MNRLLSSALAAILLVGMLVPVPVGVADMMPSSEKSLALYLAPGALSIDRPAKDAKTLNRTITPVFPLTDDVQDPNRVRVAVGDPQDPTRFLARSGFSTGSLCATLNKPPVVRVTGPSPPLPTPTTDVPVPTLPSPVPPGTYPTKSDAFCDPIWGNWTAPFQFTFWGTKAGPHLFKQAALNVWLNASKPAHLDYMEVSLRRISGAAIKDMYIWRFDGRDVDGSATDADTGKPFLLVNNKSVPLTLTAEPQGALVKDMTVKAGDKLQLHFREINITAANLTYFNDNASKAANDIKVEFGSLDHLSFLSAFLDPTSVFANGAVLGLFIDSGGKLSYQLPDPARIAEEKPVEWTPTFDRSENVTLGTVVADDSYELLGAAQANVWVKLSPQAKASTLWFSAVLIVQVEIDIIIGGKIVRTSGETFRIGTGQSCLQNGGCTSSDKDNRKELLRMAIPVAGISVPKGTEIKIQARLVGVTDPQLLVASIVYGGTYTKDPISPPKREYVPSGFKIPAVFEGQTLTVDPEALARPVVILPNGGAGAFNGTYAFEVDKRQANAAQGGSVNFRFLLKNFNNTLTDYEMKLTGVPSGVRAALAGGSGRILAGGFGYAEATLSIPEAQLLGSFQLGASANFTSYTTVNETQVPSTTPVGPLPLTVVVDQLAGAPGGAASLAKPKATGGTGQGVGQAFEGGRFKVISESQGEAPGFEWVLAAAAMLAGLGLWRRRR